MVIIVTEDGKFVHRLILEDGKWFGGDNLPPSLLPHMTTNHKGSCKALYREEMRQYSWDIETMAAVDKRLSPGFVKPLCVSSNLTGRPKTF